MDWRMNGEGPYVGWRVKQVHVLNVMQLFEYLHKYTFLNSLLQFLTLVLSSSTNLSFLNFSILVRLSQLFNNIYFICLFYFYGYLLLSPSSYNANVYNLRYTFKISKLKEFFHFSMFFSQSCRL